MATKRLHKIIQHQAYRVVFYQLTGIVILAALTLLFAGFKNGFSVLMGGMAYGLSNLGFVWRFFRYAGAQHMMQFMIGFFAGEMLKLIVSALLILVIVKTLPVSLLSVLLGFIGAIVLFWIACIGLFSKQNTL